MERWMLIGSLAGGLLAVGVRQLTVSDDQSATPMVPEASVQALSPQPIAVDVRARTSGIHCVLTSAVRTLPDRVELRTRGQLRELRVRNARMKTGQAVGDVVLPYALLDDVNWRLSELSLVAEDGARARLDVDRATGSCIAALPVAPSVVPTEIRCPVRGGGAAPSVRDMHVWDEDLLPMSWSPATAAADGDAFILFDVAPTGTAELSIGSGPGVLVRWRDGVCGPVSVEVDAQLCVHVPDGDLLHDDPSYGVFIDDEPARLDPSGVACAETRVGEAMVTQAWLVGDSTVERTVVAQVDEPARQDVELHRHPLPTAAGVMLWPSADGPRVLSVHGLGEATGLQDGDILLSIDGQSTEGRPFVDVVAALDGSRSAVAVVVDRRDVEMDFMLVFDEVDGDDDTGM